MPYSRLQVAQLVQAELEDQVGLFYAINPQINDSLQDGYDEICVATGCVQKVVNLPIQQNVIYQDLYDAIPGFYKAYKIFSYVTNRWVDCYDNRFFTSQRYDWETTVGTTWWATIVNYMFIAFYPHQNAPGNGVNNTFDFMVSIGQDLLTNDNQVLQIPDSYIRALVCYSIGDLLEQQQEFSKAGVFWLEHEEKKEALRVKVLQRAGANQYRQYEELTWPFANLP